MVDRFAVQESCRDKVNPGGGCCFNIASCPNPGSSYGTESGGDGSGTENGRALYNVAMVRGSKAWPSQPVNSRPPLIIVEHH